jgi:hypothetical protein
MLTSLYVDRIPAIRIKPDQLLPDVGAEYRNRSTGETVKLYSVLDRHCWLVRRDDSPLLIPLREFWETYCHSEVRP